jgi:carboxymethylenebutenolidase
MPDSWTFADRPKDTMTSLVPIPSPGVPLYFGEPGAPLVIVLHDWFGRLPWLEPYAVALAQRGFRVAVPDLYNGVCTVDTAAASTLMATLKVGTALALIDEIIDGERAAGSPRVGLVGFSLGGSLALMHSQSGAPDATAVYYATLGDKEHGVIPSPVLLHLAETDEWEDGATPVEFGERLREHGTPVTTHTYLGTVHGFANATVTENTDVRAAALAFARTVVFLEAHLN